MTNFEWVRSLSLGELAKLFCDHLECSDCPVRNDCYPCHNGMVEWLKAGDEYDRSR